MISSNKWGASYTTYSENPKSRCDYNKVIVAKSVIGSILKFLSVKQLSVFGNFGSIIDPRGRTRPQGTANLQA